MKFESKKIVLTNGQECEICMPQKSDAASLSVHKNMVRFETHYLMKSPQSPPFTLEGELERIEKFLSSDSSIMLIAKVDGNVVGLGIGSRKNSDVRMLHRFEISLSVQKAFWGLGIGSHLLESLVEVAKNGGFEQVELTVAGENARALHVYEKLGFKKYGEFPNSMKLPDGTYSTALFMLLDLRGNVHEKPIF